MRGVGALLRRNLFTQEGLGPPTGLLDRSDTLRQPSSPYYGRSS